MGMATAWGKRSKRRSQREQGLSKELQVQVLRHSRWWSWERAAVGNHVTDDRKHQPWEWGLNSTCSGMGGEWRTPEITSSSAPLLFCFTSWQVSKRLLKRRGSQKTRPAQRLDAISLTQSPHLRSHMTF